MKVVLNVRLKGRVAKEELVDDGLECQGSIARPGEEVCQSKASVHFPQSSSSNSKAAQSESGVLTVRVDLGGTGNDKATTSSGHLGAVGADVVEDALESNSAFFAVSAAVSFGSC